MSFKQLRRVRDHIDEFLSGDHNDHVDNWKTQLGKLSEISSKLGDPPELADLITRLRGIVDSMRKIKAGDFYMADDHNKFVDAWELQKSINEAIIRYFPFREFRGVIASLIETLDVRGPPILSLTSSVVGISTEKRVTLESSVDVVSVGGETIMPISAIPSSPPLNEIVLSIRTSIGNEIEVPIDATPSQINIYEVVATIGSEVGTV